MAAVKLLAARFPRRLPDFRLCPGLRMARPGKDVQDGLEILIYLPRCLRSTWLGTLYSKWMGPINNAALFAS